MKKRFLNIIVSVFLIVLTTMLSPTRIAQAQTPQSLYDNVWQLVNTRYLDAGYNNQDWIYWRHKYDKYLSTEDDAYIAIETMLASLNDKYTRFLDPFEFEEEGRSIKATLFGIGVQIGVKEDKLVVIAPIEDTPAFKAGLRANDEIIAIDSTSTKGMSTKDAAQKIRGKQGTYVKLLIRRQGVPQDKIYEVERDEIKLKSVYLKTPTNIETGKDIGYIRLTTFLSSNASQEILEALNEYKNSKGIILDIRSNPGGLLSNAITIADMFLKGGTIVSIVDKDGYKDEKYATRRVLFDKPLILLIDQGSASASEILSAALKENKRALLIGETTFGKGLVQEITKLPGGSGINITTQQYLTPDNNNIHLLGVEPDIAVKNSDDDIKKQNDRQLKVSLKVMQDLIDGKTPVTTNYPEIATENKPETALKASTKLNGTNPKM